MIIKFPERPKDPAALNSTPSEPPGRDHVYPLPWYVLDELPFVDPPPSPSAHKRSSLKRNCWNDKPTESGVNGYARGKRYAKMTLSAMQRNSNAYENTELGRVVSARALGCILESMIADALARQKKGGQGSRTIVTSAMAGFLTEITRYVAGAPD
jgi:hypothetical protein